MRYLTTAALALVIGAGAIAADAQQTGPNGQSGQNDQKGQHQHAAGATGQQGQTGQHTGGPTGGGPPHTGPATTPVVTPITTPNPTGQTRTTQSTGQNGQQHWNDNNGRGGLQYRNGPGGSPTGGQTTTQQFNNGQQFNRGGPSGGPGYGHQNGVGIGIAIGGNGVQVGFGFQQHPPRGRDAGRSWYNPSAFPRFFTVGRRFHAPPPFYPPGWSYRQWGYGEYLPQGWFAPNFYLNYGLYGLPTPPIGCEWIQEGQDALLVDAWSGEVLSVYRGVFW